MPSLQPACNLSYQLTHTDSHSILLSPLLEPPSRQMHIYVHCRKSRPKALTVLK